MSKSAFYYQSDCRLIKAIHSSFYAVVYSLAYTNRRMVIGSWSRRTKVKLVRPDFARVINSDLAL